MNLDKHLYVANINNKKYYISDCYDSKNHLDAVTNIINTELQKITNIYPSISNENALIVLLFNLISNELKKLEKCK